MRYIQFEAHGNVYRMDTDTGVTCRLCFNQWTYVSEPQATVPVKAPNDETLRHPEMVMDGLERLA